jgi:hypothetical protein
VVRRPQLRRSAFRGRRSRERGAALETERPQPRAEVVDVGAPSVTFGEGHESGADEHKDAGGEHDDMKLWVRMDRPFRRLSARPTPTSSEAEQSDQPSHPQRPKERNGNDE